MLESSPRQIPNSVAFSVSRSDLIPPSAHRNLRTNGEKANWEGESRVTPASPQHQLLHPKKRIWKPKSPAEYCVLNCSRKKQLSTCQLIVAMADRSHGRCIRCLKECFAVAAPWGFIKQIIANPNTGSIKKKGESPKSWQLPWSKLFGLGSILSL